MEFVYLDHAATTPVLPEVLEAMLPYYRERFGNASSIHSFGRAARDAVDEARDRAAELLGCRPQEIVFTSGGTESDNAALFGVVRARPDKLHIITSRVEHHAILHACRELEQRGCRVTYVDVDHTGQVDVPALQQAIDGDTGLISIMHTNNEVGTVQPIEEIGEGARRHNVMFHVDAVQAPGMLDKPLRDLPVDLMSFSAHKLGGPKGTGALYVSEQATWKPSSFGGAQESGRRAGTENVAGIVGFVKALELACEQREHNERHFESLRQEMIRTFTALLDEGQWVVNGHPQERAGHIFNVSFPGIDSETLLMNLDLAGVAASSGSACSAGSLQTSHVLQAMNLPEALQRSSIRFSFSPTTGVQEVRTAAKKTATIVQRHT